MNLLTIDRAFRTRVLRGLCLLVAATLAGGCSINEYIADKSAIDYKSAAARPSLEIPPDLVTPRSDERYAIPARPERTFSEYQRSATAAGAAPTGAVASRVLPAAEGVRMERLGQQRWLVVAQPPERVWPVVRNFWQENGFIIQTELPAAGILETDWAENRAKLPQDIIRRSIGRLVDALYSTGERDKFRTRLERSAAGTEIYVTHRRMVEVFRDSRGESTIWKPAEADEALENEFLARLMAKFGAPADQAAAQAAAPAAATAGARARLVTTADGGRVEIAESFDRAWRLVGLALDRGGFTVEDRDRSKGLYFVRYIDPESEARTSGQPGFFGRLFGAGSKQPEAAERFQVRVEGSERVVVSVQGADGKPVPERERKTSTRILTLLHEQLK